MDEKQKAIYHKCIIIVEGLVCYFWAHPCSIDTCIINSKLHKYIVNTANIHAFQLFVNVKLIDLAFNSFVFFIFLCSRIKFYATVFHSIASNSVHFHQEIAKVMFISVQRHFKKYHA